MSREKTTILRKTGQSGRLLGSFAVGAGGFALMVRAIAGGIATKSQRDFVIAMVGVGIAMIFMLIVPALWIRCPRCKDRWVWRAMSTEDSSNWLLSLYSATSCPACGYSADSPDVHAS